MVRFGRKDKTEVRRLLASSDAIDSPKSNHFENGNQKNLSFLFFTLQHLRWNQENKFSVF